VTQPDLFVVCKNCGSEVSPYVTECPYCGQRVRKRAPKLDKGTAPERPPRRMRLPRLRPDEIEGIAPDTRPYATVALIVVSLITTVVFAADPGLDLGSIDLGSILVPLRDEPWRWLSASFVYERELGYQFVALTAVGIFGTLLERRFGWLAAAVTFLLAGFAGNALAVVSEAPPLLGDSSVVLGGNGGALGLLSAWLVNDRRTARRGIEQDSDLLGVYVVAAVLVLLSVAVQQASIAAAAGGAAAGALLGLVLPLFTRR